MATHFSGPIVSANGFTGDVTGDITGNVVGLALQGGSSTAIAADGAIPVDTLFSIVTSDGTTAVVLTLAGGAAGQMKIIKHAVDALTANVVVTPDNLADGSTITLNADGEAIILVSDGSSWHSVYASATVA